MRGKLIVFEGPDGSGKTTACKTISGALNQKYKEEKFKVVCLPCKEACNYKEIRVCLSDPETDSEKLQNLMIENMREAIEKFVTPELDKGINIILDRWALSTLIYDLLSPNAKLNKKVDNEIGPAKYNPHSITEYFKIIEVPDVIFYFNTPLSMLIDHAHKRNSKEVNDQERTVISCEYAYEQFIRRMEFREDLTNHTTPIIRLFNRDTNPLDGDIKIYIEAYKSIVRQIEEMCFKEPLGDDES